MRRGRTNRKRRFEPAPGSPTPAPRLARTPLTTDALARGVVLAHVSLCPVVFSTAMAEGFETPKAALLLSTALILAALRLAGPPSGRLEVAPDQRARPRTLVAGVLLFFVSALASTVSSISPLTSLRGAHESFGGLLTIAAYTVLFFEVLRTTRDAADARRILFAAVMAGAVAAAYALLQWAGLDPIGWGRVALLGGQLRPFGTLGHPNLLGAYLAMTIPLAVWCWWGAPRTPLGISAAVASLAGVLAIAVTMSRGAWLALAAATMTGIVLLYRRSRPSGRAVAALAAAAIVVALAARGTELAHLIAERSIQLGPGPRLEIWRAAWGAFLDRPFLGWGLDTFQLAFPLHRTRAFEALEFNHTPFNAHNSLLNLLATQGVPGMVAAAVLAGGLLQAARHAWRTAPPQRPLVAAVSVSLVAWLVFGLTGSTVAATGSLAIVEAALLGSLSQGGSRAGAAASPEMRMTSSLAWRRAGLAVMAAGLMWVLVARPLLASATCRDAILRLERDTTPAVALAAEAARLDPLRDFYHARLGQAAVSAARRAATPRDAVSRLETAQAAYSKAVALVPVDGQHRMALASVEADLALAAGRPPDEAWLEFERAFALDPNNAMLRVAAADAAHRLRDFERARLQANEARRILPAFGAPVAQLGHLAAVEGRPGEAVSLLRESLALPWYELDHQRAIAQANLAALLLSQGRFGEAEAVARVMVGRRPDSPEARVSLARALEGLGRRDEAAAHYRAALTARPDHRGARDGLNRVITPP